MVGHLSFVYFDIKLAVKQLKRAEVSFIHCDFIQKHFAKGFAFIDECKLLVAEICLFYIYEIYIQTFPSSYPFEGNSEKSLNQ